MPLAVFVVAALVLALTGCSSSAAHLTPKEQDAEYLALAQGASTKVSSDSTSVVKAGRAFCAAMDANGGDIRTLTIQEGAMDIPNEVLSAIDVAAAGVYCRKWNSVTAAWWTSR